MPVSLTRRTRTGRRVPAGMPSIVTSLKESNTTETLPAPPIQSPRAIGERLVVFEDVTAAASVAGAEWKPLLIGIQFLVKKGALPK